MGLKLVHFPIDIFKKGTLCLSDRRSRWNEPSRRKYHHVFNLDAISKTPNTSRKWSQNTTEGPFDKKKKKKIGISTPPSTEFNSMCVCVTQPEAFNGSALVYMLDRMGCQPRFPGMPPREARRGIFPQLEGNPKPERQVQRGRKRRSSGRTERRERIVSAHLPGDCRVQITPQLLEICVRRVLHLESLL